MHPNPPALPPPHATPLCQVTAYLYRWVCTTTPEGELLPYQEQQLTLEPTALMLRWAVGSVGTGMGIGVGGWGAAWLAGLQCCHPSPAPKSIGGPGGLGPADGVGRPAGRDAGTRRRVGRSLRRD